MARRSANKRKQTKEPWYSKYLIRRKEERDRKSLEDLPFVDFLTLTASGDISMEDVDNWNKAGFKRQSLIDKIERITDLHSNEEMVYSGKKKKLKRPRFTMTYRLDRQMAKYKAAIIPLPDMPIGQNRAVGLIEEAIETCPCPYRVLEFASELLRLDINFIAYWLNKKVPKKGASYISKRRLRLLNNEHRFQKFYAEGQRRYIIAVNQGLIKPLGGGLAMFDQTSLEQAMPGSLRANLVVVTRYLTNQIHINGRRYVDIYSTSGAPLRSIKT